MLKIKKGDTVKVIAGKDKDKEGKVIAVNAKKNTVTVEGINMVTKHTKPSMANQAGGIVQQEGPIDVSNVMYVHKGAATPVSYTHLILLPLNALPAIVPRNCLRLLTLFGINIIYRSLPLPFSEVLHLCRSIL